MLNEIQFGPVEPGPLETVQKRSFHFVWYSGLGRIFGLGVWSWLRLARHDCHVRTQQCGTENQQNLHAFSFATGLIPKKLPIQA
jgi:hypothetical protein